MPQPAWARAMMRLCALVVGVLLVAGCTHEVSLTPPSPPTDNAASRADAAQKTLDGFARALNRGESLAATSRVEAVATRNAAALGVRRVGLRYIDANVGALSAADQRRLGASAWVASVQASYRLPMDTAATHMEVAFTFVTGTDGVQIASIGGHGDRSPLWMRAALRIKKVGRTLVLDAGAVPAARYSTLAQRAVRDVNRVLPGWRGNLIVEVAADEQQMDSVLNAQQPTYANIAAVTTTVDGSLLPGTPIHVFLNPRVFGTLKTEGAQIVLSHESTHVATDGPLANMPTWLLEGFADYVALDHAGVPVSTAAGQILERIRKHGLPAHLPSAADLDPTAGGLGATYEEAWLACRYLGAAYGEARLVAFYRAVDRGTKVGTAFRSVLGVSQQQFVAGWRADLAGLAG